MPLVPKGKHRKGEGYNPPLESYPSEHAPRNFYAKDAARRREARGTHIPAEDAENDFGNCCQCNAPQRLSDSPTCWHCGSDNRTNREL